MASKLGVETISHTNGTTAATIDSSGRILTPARPAFHATLSAATVTFTSTNDDYEDLVMDNAITNIGNHYSTSTGRFTAPVDGMYFFSANVRFDSMDNTNYARLLITTSTDNSPWNESGQTFSAIIGNQQATNYHTLNVAGCIYLNANDVVRLKGGHRSDTSYQMHKESQFSGFLVG